MSLLPTVYLAAEDLPGLAVGRRLIAEASPLLIHREENGHGYGTLRKKVKNYQKMASFGYPVLMLTDLDRVHCPSELLRNWISEQPHPNFLFRIAVREVESWLLADSCSLAEFLQIEVIHIPADPDSLVDAKSELLKLAQRSPRKIRTGLLPRPGSRATIGPEYNSLLNQFIISCWDIEKAAQQSPSLQRARSATMALAIKLRASF